MTNIHERIKDARIQLHLSQDYVARFLGISRHDYAKTEDGRRDVPANELAQLSELFGIPADDLLNDNEKNLQSEAFMQRVEGLGEKDKAAVMDLIKLKERIRTPMI